jgi:predicted transcriptional regulator
MTAVKREGLPSDARHQGNRMRVSELMSQNVVRIEDTTSCRQAVERMVRNKIRHLAVVGHDGRLRGHRP